MPPHPSVEDFCEKHDCPIGDCTHAVQTTVNVRTPLAQAHWFQPVLRTQEGQQDLKSQALREKENVDPVDSQQDVPKKEG